jgi:hypothetical protein
MHNVRDHGASGRGRTPDTDAIQSAIDACEGGGTVEVPPGRYLAGTLHLRNDATLQMDAGAVLLGSRDPSDYPQSRVLLEAEGVERIAILGRGTIDGQATGDLGRRPGHADEERPSFRTRLVLLDGCDNVRIRDLTMRNSDSWALHLRRCSDAVVDGVTVLNNYFRTNTDGINPDSCRNVRIANCNVVAGDDCICLKARDGHPCENVVVTNCTTESIATAIKLGTESSGDFRDILITNCTIRNSTVGLGIYVKDGATVERVTFSNISIGTLENPSLVNAPRLRNAIYPILFDVERRTASSPTGKIRDVIVRDIHVLSDNGVLIQGMPESPIEGISLDNILVRVPRGFDYSQRIKHAGGRANPDDERITLYARKPSYVTLAHVAGFTVDNLRVVMKEETLRESGRSALSIYDSREGLLGQITRSPQTAPDWETEPVVSTVRCLEMRYRGGRIAPTL